MTTIATPNAPASSLDELAERVDTLARDVNRTPVLSVIRGLMNETQIRRARAVLQDAPDLLGNAQEALRTAQEAERVAREEYEAAALEGEWAIGDTLVTEGRDTYLVIGEGIEQQRKKLLADEKRAYVAAAVAKMPAVAKAAAALHDATEGTAAARDAVEVARARLSVAKADLNASVAELAALTLAIPHSMKAAD